MIKCLLLISSLFLVSVPVTIESQTNKYIVAENVDYPEIPRVTAYEAYVKYKQGKALIIHAGGDTHSRRHVLGSFNLDLPEEKKEAMLLKFPKRGLEVFIY